MADQQTTHSVTTRHIVETKWYCVDRERCDELDQLIASATHHFNSLSANVADKYITGLECLEREAKLQNILRALRDERKTLWRRGKKEIDETIDDETGKVIATTRKVVQPRAVDAEPPSFEAVLIDPSVEGKPLVRIRNV